MAIDVICTGCHKRFQVSEQFAGRKGPCPACKTIIEIPKLEDVVVVHEREQTKTGAPAKLDSIRRQRTTVSKLELIISGATLVVGLALAFAARFSISETVTQPSGLINLIAGLSLGVATSCLSYVILRNQDAEIINDKSTLFKGIGVGLLYGGVWRLQHLIIDNVLMMDGTVILPAVIILALATVAIVSFAPMAAFEFEYSQGFISVCLFVAMLAIYSLIAGDIGVIIS